MLHEKKGGGLNCTLLIVPFCSALVEHDPWFGAIL